MNVQALKHRQHEWRRPKAFDIRTPCVHCQGM